jgi:hypothetical protein
MVVDVPFQAVSGVTLLFPIHYEIGAWLGPVRVVAEPGIFGIAGCSTEVCGENTQGQGRAAPMLPLGLGISAYPWQSGIFALGTEARLQESYVWLPARGGTERFFIHSPQGVMHFSIAPSSEGDGLPGGPRLFSADFEASFGALIVHRDGRTTSAPMLGGGFMLHTWL